MARFTIIGFDPGFDRLGYAVIAYEIVDVVTPGQVHLQDLELLDLGVLTMTQRKDWKHGLKELFTDIDSLVKLHNATIIGIEKLFWGTNVTNAIQVAKVIGIIELTAAFNNIDVVYAHPSSVKKFITGSGKASKENVKVAVYKLLGLDESASILDDSIDALAIAVFTAFAR